MRSLRRRRGFTLLEVTLGLTLTVGLLLLSLRWVGTMGQLSQISGERAEPARAATYLAERFGADMDATVSCDAQRRDGPVASIGDQELWLVVDDNNDGVADYIKWSLDTTSDPRVVRAVYVGESSGVCALPNGSTPDSQTVVATGLRAETAKLFAPVDNGELVMLTQDRRCLDDWSVCSPWDAVALRAVFESDDGGVVVMKDMFRLRNDSRRL